MKLFAHWRELARAWSTWLIGAAITIITAALAAPDFIVNIWTTFGGASVAAYLPARYAMVLGVAINVLALLARLIKQEAVAVRIKGFIAWFKHLVGDTAGELKKAGQGAALVAALLALVGPVAYERLHKDVPAHEGTVNKGYLDPVRIPTKCSGDTTDVVVGRIYTDEECRVSLDTQLLAHARPVLVCSPELKDQPYILAATIDLTYNIGASAYCRSTVAKRFRAGDYAGGCAAMSAWVYAGGRKLPGLVKRRADNRALCERGL